MANSLPITKSLVNNSIMGIGSRIKEKEVILSRDLCQFVQTRTLRRVNHQSTLILIFINNCRICKIEIIKEYYVWDRNLSLLLGIQLVEEELILPGILRITRKVVDQLEGIIINIRTHRMQCISHLGVSHFCRELHRLDLEVEIIHLVIICNHHI